MSRVRTWRTLDSLRIEIEGAGFREKDAAVCVDYYEDEPTQAVIFTPHEDEPLCRIVFEANGEVKLIVHNMATEIQEEKYSSPGDRVYMFPRSSDDEDL